MTACPCNSYKSLPTRTPQPSDLVRQSPEFGSCPWGQHLALSVREESDLCPCRIEPLG